MQLVNWIIAQFLRVIRTDVKHGTLVSFRMVMEANARIKFYKGSTFDIQILNFLFSHSGRVLGHVWRRNLRRFEGKLSGDLLGPP